MSLLRYRISPEGFPYLFAVLSLGTLSYYFVHQPYVLVSMVVLTCIIFYIFRDSKRDIPSVPLGVVSPIDGEIIDIQKADLAKLECEGLRIKIRGHALGTYVLRGPTEGKVNRYWVEGRTQFYCIETDEGDRVALGLDVGLMGYRPRLKTQVGERVGQGRRFGFIPAATEVTLAIAGDPRTDITIGQDVRSGETIVATIRH